MTEPVVAAIGLGGNVGDAAATLRQAAQALDALPGTRLLRLSRLYRTPAWGVEDQPDFVNAVALVQTALAPRPLLEALLEVERRFGRDRARERRWGPRTLDLDVLLYGAQVVDEPGLQLPHPRLHLRAFALAPLLEVAPDAEIPGFGPARNAASAMDMSNIHPL
ncbi:2-amino-4-hydroxy-6-hydroxymethyldihydropteridine diphosphokinase [Pseudoxanthomonas mexicana]|uniref:2-amino-4-hydroxy-6- hydroxymethyldihydropteridine diphosphokinase n=1 Tax=Pseudoxanthomonas mexicana TaxID=128785 RepID=UPI00398A9FC1